MRDARQRLTEVPQWWAKRRLGHPLRIANFPLYKEFVERLVAVIDEFQDETLYERIAPLEAKHLNQVEHSARADLLFAEGSPNFHLFTLTHQGYYSLKNNPLLHLWRSCEIDPHILSKFQSLSNNKFHQPASDFAVEMPYDLYLMQTSEAVEKSDIQKAVIGAKALTLFKDHPASDLDFDYLSFWQSLYGVNPSTKLVRGANLDTMISGAKKVYTSSSAAIFNAALQGKLVGTYRTNYLSEIVPMISSADDCRIVPEADLKRWLSWYYHRVVIDLRDSSCEDKMRLIIKSYIEGRNFKETFGCK